MSKLKEFEKDITEVINRHSIDNFVGVADFILAEYVTTTLAALKEENHFLGYDKLNSGSTVLEENHY